MFELAANITNATLPIIVSTSGQIIPGLSNIQLLLIGQLCLGILLITTILLQLRNIKIGRLLVRDKTIMFAGFINKQDYERVLKEKGHLFRLIPESEVQGIEKRELNGHNVWKGSEIVPDEEDGHLKKKDN